MAKTKKQEKPIEQRLEETLVLYEKTPYELPSNWCWTRLGTVCKLDNGIKNDREELFYLDAKTLRTQNYEQTRRNGVVVEEGEKVILVDGENSGEVFDIPKRGYMGSTFRILKINELVNEVYVRYFISSHQDELRNNKIGSAIPHLNKELFFNLIFPLAPLEEQKRIVEIIEKQFAKLDEARDLIQASLDSFADRKSAILHRAFMGELTKNWREKSKLNYDAIIKKLKDCCKISSGGTPSRKHPEYYDGNIPWIKTGEIEWNEIYDSEEHISEVAVQNSSAKCYEPEVVLVAMYGMGVTRGRAAILKVRAATNQAVCVLKPNNSLLIKYLYYYFMCYYWDIREQAVGGNQLNLSGTIISQLEISIPSIEEQEEIVRILDSIFEKEDKSKELIDMLDKIDEMKKSILARAFLGQLGTSNPTDEPATDLLRKILEQSN